MERTWNSNWSGCSTNFSETWVNIIRVHPCNLQLKGNTFVTKNNSSSTPDVSNGPTELRKNSNEFHQDSKQSFENASVLYETEKECEVNDDDANNSETNSEINVDTNEYYNGLNKPKVRALLSIKYEIETKLSELKLLVEQAR